MRPKSWGRSSSRMTPPESPAFQYLDTQRMLQTTKELEQCEST